ncbi:MULTISPECIES: hypothetical protein [Shouchella]|uniref:Uncharacterized protein n=3 Tax=Bacillaceae TaxID=186817 RepID=A0A060LXQ5_9BACI|nr:MULTISPECIES: hypothetical protein [Bacillaceae]RQW20423.1 hypothetical protein EH196_09905 [Bacillus sp. C1-1]AIC94550.1 hypothetical protein BleG1_1972 [Shouchella lehensis G1]KQL51887.1 hypothetical protein AN965_19210 [Alkalicoccobacillus plakortidis]MBG9784554.1 hypothetical protein [Shouchella lehensis]TES50437.1 hypothetical protein E2L03_00445 [Shouchella lehensis]
MTPMINALREKLEREGKEDIVEIIDDAAKGHLEEVEIVPSIGLLYDQEENKQLLTWLEEQGVTITEVTDEEE